MKKYFTLFIILFISHLSFSQSTVLKETTLKITGAGEQNIYYGFAAGDKIIVSFDVDKGKELKEFEVIEYPSNSVYKEFKTSKVANKVIEVNKDGIYRIRLKNGSLSKRYCQLKIERIPGSAGSNWDTEVYWKTIRDTTYYTVNEKYIISTDTIIATVAEEYVRLEKTPSSTSSKVIQYNMPDSIDNCSYYIGVGNEGDLAYQLANLNIICSHIDSITKYETYDPLTATNMGHNSYLQPLKGNNSINFFMLKSGADLALYNAGQPFNKSGQGNGTVNSGLLTDKTKGVKYIALRNPHTGDAVDVNIKIQSIRYLNNYGTREVQKFKVKVYQEPYLKND